MRWAGAVLPILLLAGGTAPAAPELVDGRGNLIAAEAVTVVGEDGGSRSAIRIRQTAPDGKVTEEFVPETIDVAADLSPQVLFDTASGRVLVIWIRQDGAKMSLAGASRGDPGEWSPVARLDTGGIEPSNPRADVDSDSRLHVVFRTEDAEKEAGLRHRAYDLTSLQPDGQTTDPFAIATPAKDRRNRRAGEAPPAGGGDTKSTAFTEYGVEVGCGVAVVWRAAGSRLEVASLIEGRWRRGDVDLGDDPGRARPESLAAEIAKRFCRP